MVHLCLWLPVKEYFMRTVFSGSLPLPSSLSASAHSKNESRIRNHRHRSTVLLLGTLIALASALTGCGSGGYAGGGIESLSSTALILDAGQSFNVTSASSTGSNVAWSLAGSSCSGASCGALSSATGSSITYTAPSGVTTQFQTTLTAAIPGTKSSKTVAITVNPVPTITGTLAPASVGVAYSATLTSAGGSSPLKGMTLTSGALPTGLTFNATTGVISGTPTQAGSFSFTISNTDSSTLPYTVTTQKVIAVSTPVTSTISIVGAVPAGTVGTAYSGSLQASGGTAPYTYSILSGSLPTGLQLSAAGAIAGTPTTQGSFSFTAQAQDSTGATTSATFSVAIAAAASTLTVGGSLPNGTINIPYSQPIGLTGGTAPYTCSIVSGTLPTGLTLGPNCVVSGTPTTAGTFTIVTKVTDSGNPTQSVTSSVTITILPTALTLTSGTLPNGTVNVSYSQVIGVSGGTAPYACSILSGSLPAGLSIGANCLVSGTPTVAGTSTISVKATDASNPIESVTGNVSITIAPAALSFTVTSLPNGMVNVPYSQTIGVTGGTAPYACTITSGTLPAGLALGANCLVSGTPTTAGTANLTVKATDSSSPTESVTGPVALTIAPATLTISSSSLPNGTVAVPYSQTIGISGGTSPYSCVIIAGTLPAGLTLGANCLVSGTPTLAGTSSLTVKAIDSSNPTASTSGPVSLTIAAASSTLTITGPGNATVNTPYTGMIGVTGGTAPYTCQLTAGTIPAGLTLTNCTITGTPTTPGSSPLTVKVTDSSSPTTTNTGNVTLTVAAATPTLTLIQPATATIDTPYTGTIGVSGGTGPYACVVQSGTLPAGLSVSNCTITGTPTATGSSILTVTATDSSTPTGTITGPITVTVQALQTLTLTGSLPNATQGVAYSQTLTAKGGLAPYTYAVTSGTLPDGITLSSAGVFSGTPTTVGASSFTVTATDSQSTPHTASLPLILQVLYPNNNNDSILKGPYAFLFQGYDDVVAGVLAYQTASIGSFTADGAGAINSGEMDSNHQSSQPSGTTVASQTFLGTYTIGTDDRGFLTLTTLTTAGTVDTTHTYSIALKAPVAPATISTQGSLIESDSNQLQGTKGSGSLLAQDATTFGAGLNGSFAFGLSGDTPCLPACTVGVVAGPAATVGEFTTNGAGLITGGMADNNVGSTSLTNLPLSGTYGTADGNGRAQLTLNTGGTVAGVYPDDYAVYMVNATQAFVMSTDTHSGSILLAGSTQQRTQSSFTNASLGGPFIGYENSATNPGLVSGLVLQNVLNFSTATIFRGTGTQDGNCTITNLDEGGLTALTSRVTGLLGSLSGLTGLLGADNLTGAMGCTVAGNGRSVLQYPPATLLGLPLGTAPAPRIAYLSAPNQGYFLETGYAALGHLEAQTGAPFTLANTFTGTYIYGSTPASSLASINSTGTIVSNGAGQATSTLDLNVGVGTINLITLGQTATQAYTTPDATTGRFTLNGNLVLYAITPNRFVLVDTDPLTTSPSVSLLY
jgi:hypothetical protein